MITHGKREWLPELKGLWMEAFGDESRQVEEFYRLFYREEYTWCYTYRDMPVSVIYGIPALLWGASVGEKHAFVYFYAGATKEKYRGRGYYGKLIKKAGKSVRIYGRGGFGGLVPAEGMTDYYLKQGFYKIAEEAAEDFAVSDYQDMEEQPEPVTVYTKTISAKRYKEIRDARLGAPGYVEWEEKYLSYAIQSIIEMEGIAKEIKIGEGYHILLAKVKGDFLDVIETTMDHRQIAQILSYLPQTAECVRVRIRETILLSAQKDWKVKPYFKISME